MIQAAEDLAAQVGVGVACDTLGVSRATLYRRRQPKCEPRSRSKPHRALAESEREAVVALLNSDRFMDLSVREIWATLLDEGVHLASIRTIYRILAERKQTRERRNQLRHPNYKRPELLATGPNQLWSWDITKLRGPHKWTCFHLYVILDVYSRYVVGWIVASKEAATLAEHLISETFDKQGVKRDQLTLHADRGASMRSKLVAQLLGDLGVTKTHSRPHVSNDNPYSEAQFKTLKYRPKFPDRFGSQEDATSFCRGFFRWYNKEHHHTALALLTPEDVHYGRGETILASRHQVLLAAAERHPERFVNGPPKLAKLPGQVWINPPQETSPKEKGRAIEPDPNRSSTSLSAQVASPQSPTLWAGRDEPTKLRRREKESTGIPKSDKSQGDRGTESPERTAVVSGANVQ